MVKRAAFFGLAVLFLLLSACLPYGADTPSQTVDPGSPGTNDMIPADPSGELDATATLTLTPAKIPTRTPAPEPTQTATLEPTPAPPELPFRVNEGVAETWDHENGVWVLDEGFPAPDNSAGRTLILDRYETDSRGTLAAFDKYYNELLAIRVGEVWVKPKDLTPGQLGIVELSPGTLSFANPDEWSFGRQLDEQSAKLAYMEMVERIIDLNPEYFRWLVSRDGRSDISVEAVIDVLSLHEGELPVPDEESVPKLIIPARDGRAQIISHSRAKNAEIDRGLKLNGMGLVIFNPTDWESNFKLQALFQVADTHHLIGIGQSIEWSQTGIIILPDGRLIFVHGVPKYSDADNPSHREYTLAAIIGLAETPEALLVTAYYEAYLETFDPDRVGDSFIPLAPDSWSYSQRDSVTTGNRADPITLPVLLQNQTN